MKPERNRQIDRIFQAALEREPIERGAFLNEACADDPSLRREVEALLDSHERAGSFIESPAVEAAALLLADQKNHSIIDHPIGPYRILSHLGSGGMGEVYLAQDSRLGRRVALKILPEFFTRDEQRVRRFKQEARAASALNHPNIITIHDIGESEGRHFIATEYVEGETLRQRLAKRRMNTKEVLNVAVQVASGLAAAHQAGIVHRDIKPENIMLRRDGYAKVLDFGLAKLTERRGAALDTQASTLDKVDTAAGIVVGTVGYMSPEQVRGEQVDYRSDIFSFGAVLFEMLSGRRAFKGDSAVEILNAILKEDPSDLSRTDSNISLALERVLRHCLEKSPEARFQSARDLAFDLETLLGLSGSNVSPKSHAPGRVISRERLTWIAAVISLLALLTTLPYLFHYFRSGPTEVVRFPINMPERTSFAGFASVSPDGRRVVLRASNAAGGVIYVVRPLNSPDAQPLLGTEGGEFCFWSPDSRSLAFGLGGKIKKLDFSGEPPQTVCEGSAVAGGSWGRDGIILFSAKRGIFSVPASGGDPQPVRMPDGTRGEKALVFPSFLPDGRHFLYFAIALSEQPGAEGAYVASLDSPESKRIVSSDMAAAYANPGYLLFVRGGTLLAQPFNASRLELNGEPMEVARRVTTGTPYSYAPYSVSDNGVLVYQSGLPIDTQLVWLDRTGKELGRVGSAGAISEPVLSQDEKWVAFPRRDTQSKRDIWLLDLERGATSRLTSSEEDNAQPIWSPDGRSIVFDKRNPSKGAPSLYEKTTSGAGEERLLLELGKQEFPEDWSRDGRYILFTNYDPVTHWDLWVLPTFGDHKPAAYLHSRFEERQGVFSPDGKWVAYSSDESGRLEVYVQSFPAPGFKLQVSNGGGDPRWSRDGKELFYIALDQKLMSAELKADSDRLTAGIPRPLFETDVVPVRDMRNHFDVSADGRFLFAIPVQKASGPRIDVVVNWTADLKR